MLHRSRVDCDCCIGNSRDQYTDAIWLRTPGDAWLGRLIGLPGIRQIARVGYNLFANLLFAWNRRKGHW